MVAIKIIHSDGPTKQISFDQRLERSQSLLCECLVEALFVQSPNASLKFIQLGNEGCNTNMVVWFQILSLSLYYTISTLTN